MQLILSFNKEILRSIRYDNATQKSSLNLFTFFLSELISIIHLSIQVTDIKQNIPIW